jgi:GT2 family glycosyltransferase
VANWEEVDFAHRLRAAGRNIFYEPTAEIMHQHAPDGGCRAEQRPARYHAVRYYNDGLFFGRNPRLLSRRALWRREKNNIEFYTRKKTGGRNWGKVGWYFGAFFTGLIKGKL